MSGGGLRLGTFAGAPIILDWTVAILAGYILATDLARGGVAALPASLIYVGALLLAILLHELGHAATAAAFKIPPGAIMLTFFGGYVSFLSPPRKRWHGILVAFAGPAANLAFAAGAAMLGAYLAAGDLDLHPPEMVSLRGFLSTFMIVNLLLGVFNLLPGYPLDGGAIVSGALGYVVRPARAEWITAWLGVVIATALAVYGFSSGNAWTGGVGLLLALSAFAGVNRAQRALNAAKLDGERRG